MISIKVSGSTDRTEAYLRRQKNLNVRPILERYGRDGVTALARATPVDSGLAANSWTYKVVSTRTGFSITWNNTDVENGFPVAIMLQYGYSTGTGGYVSGRDYINPAIRPIFDRMADELWREVTRG